jgi:multisubunit Na+/H+ antiporter MnhG subunit
MQQFQARQIVASIVLLIISCLILNSIGLHSARAAQFDDWKDWEKTVEAAKKKVG